MIASPTAELAAEADMGTERLRVAIADDDPEIRRTVAAMLRGLGHEVVFAGATGRELVNHCLAETPDLVMTDIEMPDMDGLDAAMAIYERSPAPIIVLTAFCRPELIERAEHNHILGYLMKPATQSQIEAGIAMAVRRHQEFEALRKEAADLRQSLADRKVIERAKGLLMKHLGVDEPEAFRRLQKFASNKNKKLVEIAETIVTASEALNGKGPVGR
ncbi:MAG TPA: ANTAR domain-containing protein [Pirellulales bacterium]|nr:ANTAR domain-containing protein [Pirellulales bacterium]